MIRSLLVAAAAVGVVLGSAAFAQQQQQQRMPSSPPPQGGATTSQPSGSSGQTMDNQPMGTQTRSGSMSGPRDQRQSRQGSKLDSIASGLNECQLRPQDQRQSCIDQVIRENGG